VAQSTWGILDYLYAVNVYPGFMVVLTDKYDPAHKETFTPGYTCLSARNLTSASFITIKPIPGMHIWRFLVMCNERGTLDR
jgi:hypothetical protein